MSQATNKFTVPKFTQEQLEWLQRICPENTDVNATHTQLMYNMGRRSVLKDIEAHVSYVVRDIGALKSL